MYILLLLLFLANENARVIDRNLPHGAHTLPHQCMRICGNTSRSRVAIPMSNSHRDNEESASKCPSNKCARRLDNVKRHLTESVVVLPPGNGTSGVGLGRPLEENSRVALDYIHQNKPEKYSVLEWELRCKLAVAYRIADYYNWKQVIFNHITVRIPGSEKEENGPHFLINPLGLRFNEMTASSLMKVTIDGEIIDQGTTDGTLFRQGYVIHSAIHEVRHDVMCCWHCHQHDATAISMTKGGLLPLSQEALDIFPLIAYHPFEGTANSLDERPRLQKSLGDNAMILVLENHGPCALGPNIETAFHLMYFFCRSATYQQRAMAAVGGDLSVTFAIQAKA